MTVPHVSIEDGLLRLYDQLSEDDQLTFATMLVACARATDPIEEPEVEGFGLRPQRFGSDLDTLADTSQVDQMRMQQYLERRSKAFGTLTNVVTKLDLMSDQMLPNYK